MTDLDTPVPPPPIPDPDRGPSADDANPPVAFAAVRLLALLGAFVALGVWRPWVLVVVLALVGMIFLHELGHYLMAKRAGMKVTEFFLFFGPRIWSFRRGETEYGIKCIPAGAYVKIIGMTNLDEVAPEDEARTYRQKTFAQRVGVAVAGSTMHFLLALVCIFVALVVIGQPAGSIDPRAQERDWTIGEVVDGSGAAKAGLREGDRLVRIGDTEINSFDDLRTVGGAVKGETVEVTYLRDGGEHTVPVTFDPFYSWYVQRVVAGTGPAEAGLEVGDEILTVDGRSLGVKHPMTILDGVEGSTVPVTFEREQADGTVMKGRADVEIESLILGGNEGYLGVGRAWGDPEKLSAFEALWQTPKQFVQVAWYSIGQLGSFFSPKGISGYAGQVGRAQERDGGHSGPQVPRSDETSATLLSGGAGTVGAGRMQSIYGLVRLSSDAGEIRPSALVLIFATVNIFIGVFNLVPLLPFDGGHVMIALYEKLQERRLRRRRYFVDASRLLPLTYAVVAVLGLLFISSLYLDIVNPISL